MLKLPPPMLPPEVDLRNFPFMPLFGDRLFQSETWITASDAGRVAAMQVWWRAWHEVPAASLPDDDRLLAYYAGYGTTASGVRAWRRIRGQALRGFVKCADGRLWHRLLAVEAAKSWNAKLLDQWTKERGRAAKEYERAAAEARKAGLPEPAKPAARAKPAEVAPVLPAAPSPSPLYSVSHGQGGDVAATEECPSPRRDAPAPPSHAHDAPARGVAGHPAENALNRQGQGQGQGQILSEEVGRSSQSPPEGDDADVAAIVAAFDAAVVETWGARNARPGADDGDRETAARWLRQGVRPPLVARVCRQQFGQMRARKVGRPYSLMVIETDILRAVSADAPEPEPAPLVAPPGLSAEALGELEQALGRATVKAWVLPLTFDVGAGGVTVRAPGNFHREWVESHLEAPLRAVFERRPVRFELQETGA